jgi:hypothetical protein
MDTVTTTARPTRSVRAILQEEFDALRQYGLQPIITDEGNVEIWDEDAGHLLLGVLPLGIH